ncbi:lysin B [Gordonia phage GrootJr]|uniref:Lysin B n=1 Tax=Gordonia phage NatB6 TaxID=2250322 RepID=A0A345L4U7_9CAUD|nr:lysin B [Gordonia phage NatB6]AXH50299.1 lysin B [Gordonia phage NatB6]QOP66680.1 lysin B [Gordonia phage NovumRegina]QOR55861.1 lysin B [Gordonia phage GrootJr]
MSDIVLRTMRGTGEPLESPMMNDIVEACRELGVPHRPVQYWASIAPAGGTKMFHESYADGWHRGAVADAEGPASIWVGYSLGALIAGDLAAAGELANCILMILISDPLRHDRQIAPECRVPRGLYGCAGSRYIPDANFPVVSLSVPNDPISALEHWNGFRQIASVITGTPQRWDVGNANIGAIVDAARRYLGTPPNRLLGTPAKPSRHVVYNSEKMPGLPVTYTQFAARAAEQAIEDYRAV